jgi:hypothetical protein
VNDEPRRIFLGSYEAGTTHVIIPSQAVNRANEAFDRERKRREMEAAKAKLRVLQDARSAGRLKRALASVFRRGRSSR